MTLHPQARAHAAWAATFDAVASQLAKSARSDGGTLLASAADLHKLGTGEAWPRSALELERVTLPELARRPDAAGCTVQRLADGRWYVVPVALPAATAQPAAAPLPAATQQPVAVPVARPVAAAPSEAEFECVQAAAHAVITRGIGTGKAARGRRPRVCGVPPSRRQPDAPRAGVMRHRQGGDLRPGGQRHRCEGSKVPLCSAQ